MTRTFALVAAVALTLVALKLLIENLLGFTLEPLVQAWLTQAGTGSTLLVVGLLAADVVLPVPSSVIMVLSGAAFGVVWGALLGLTGSILGEWLGFELVRRYGRGFAARRVGDAELDRFARLFAKDGALAIVVTRPLPVVMETLSLVAGLSRMPRRTFLAASVAGTLPVVLVHAYAGAVSREMGSAIPAVVMLLAVAGFAWVLYRTRLHGMTDRPPEVTPPSTSSSGASPD